MDIKEFLLSSMGNDILVSDVYVSNIEFDISQSLLIITGNGSTLVFSLKKRLEYIKFTYHIISTTPSCRMKLFYGDNNNFTEEQSILLAPIRNKETEHIFNIKKSNSIRIDFIPESSELELIKFRISEPLKKEKNNIIKERNKRVLSMLFSSSTWNYKNLGKFLRLVRISGLKRALSTAVSNHAGKSSKPVISNASQVMQPYTVKIKEPLNAERKKVLHIIENFYTGGSSRLIIDLIEYLGHIYEQKIFTMAYRGETEFLNVDITTINVDEQNHALEQIKYFKPDIIHVHIWQGDWYNNVFKILSKVDNCVIIENINTPLPPIVKDFINKYIFVSSYVLKAFYEQNAKSQVIYPGSNFNMFSRELSGNYLAADTIGMVYRLDYDKLSSKSIDVFIRAVEKRPGTQVIIVGGGERYEEYKYKVEEAGLTSSFIFTGYVPYDTLPDWYKKFTVFAAPVWQESFGQVSPFAMNMGIPVVGYNVGALEEIINDKSLLAAANDIEHLSDIIVDLLNNYDKCLTVGLYNHKRASDNFSVEKMISAYKEVYAHV